MLVTAIAFLQITPVFAASTDTHQQPAASSGLFIAFAIAYLSRRRAIGGWLLYFYLQMYLSLLISLLFVPRVITNLKPSNWDNALLYVMFFFSVVPVLVVELVEVVVATRLLFTRSEENLNVLRWTLNALIVASVASIGIDLVWFKEDTGIVFDFITALFFAVIWAVYFRKARRVRVVFIDNNWAYDSQFTKRILTAEDKKILRKRALFASLVRARLLPADCRMDHSNRRERFWCSCAWGARTRSD